MPFLNLMFSLFFFVPHWTESKGLKLCFKNLIFEAWGSKFGAGFIHLKDTSLIASEVIIFNMTREKCINVIFWTAVNAFFASLLLKRIIT